MTNEIEYVNDEAAIGEFFSDSNFVIPSSLDICHSSLIILTENGQA